MLWQSVLDEYEERDPQGAARARAIATTPTRPLYGASTLAAARAWPHLDIQARLDWIWVCRFVNHTWVHNMQTALGFAS